MNTDIWNKTFQLMTSLSHRLTRYYSICCDCLCYIYQHMNVFSGRNEYNVGIRDFGLFIVSFFVNGMDRKIASLYDI